jgi:hypothetical protein
MYMAGNYGYVSLTFNSIGVSNAQRALGDVSLGRYNKNPRMRIQKAENVNRALEFINSRGVKLTNIGPEGTSLIWSVWRPVFTQPQISSMVT